MVAASVAQFSVMMVCLLLPGSVPCCISIDSAAVLGCRMESLFKILEFQYVTDLDIINVFHVHENKIHFFFLKIILAIE